MEKSDYRVLGVMSGTSLDGVDIALLEFQKQDAWRYKILQAETIPYESEWEGKLTQAVNWADPELKELNEDYTRLLAKLIKDFIQRHQLQDLDAVCSHGHTIKHEPQNGFTLQVGNLPLLAELLDEVVVCDFRVQDVQLGGQGAPLVPIGDRLLFGDYDYCLNLGGFANVSTQKGGERIAYDICPVNTVLNFLSQKLKLPYDHNGEIAASGKLDPVLLERLNALEFYRKSPPKSLGIEWVNENILPMIENAEDIPSLLHTYVIHSAIQIAGIFNDDPGSRVLVTGGGAFNKFLMQEIRSRTRCQVEIPSSEVVNFKEALIFGLLGVLKLRNEVNTLSSVTGAKMDHSAGVVYEKKLL